MKTYQFETNFTVMPAHCNYMTPLIFGGKLMAELDLAAAGATKQALRESVCDQAVTFLWNGKFHGPSYLVYQSISLIIIAFCHNY